METKSLLYGIIGLMLGGLIVSVAATLEKPGSTDEMSMSQMTQSLAGKKGDDYDKAFIDNMIDHHQAAVDMAMLSAENAKHEEIKQLSRDIITAQEKEINQMKQWRSAWGYTTDQMDMAH